MDSTLLEHAFLNDMLQLLRQAVPTLLVITAIILVIKFINRKPATVVEGHKFRDQLLTLLLVIAGLVGVVLTLPLTDSARGQLFTLLGLLLTAIITLSSPTIAANALAGFMLRSLRNFSPGDFIQVGDYYGRVTEQDLFHTEIQTADRDLLTIPNTYLAANPIKVVHASGTMVSAEVSLGYDIDRHLVEQTLLEAAAAAELEEAFVTITELGDYSIVYRVTGLLKQVKNILYTRSQLRKQMLDFLHAQKIEIVSPAFMNQRRVENPVLPALALYTDNGTTGPDLMPDQLMFDKAEKAQQLKELKDTYIELKQTLDAGTDKLDEATMEKTKRRLSAMERLMTYLEKSE